MASSPIQTMGAAALEAFGVTEQQEREISGWTLERVGYVLGADGRGGSGVFVEMPNGSTALLTARHVLVRAILSGDIAVAGYIAGVARSVQPVALRISARADGALLFVPGDLQVARLSCAEWDPNSQPQIAKGRPVIAAGVPRCWKDEPDLEKRRINSMKTLLFWTAVVAPPEAGVCDFIQCDIDEKIPGLPSTFRGMSGGPVFSLNQELVGINKGECRGDADGILFSLPREAWRDLYYPLDPTADMPSDYRRQEMGAVFFARDESQPDDAAPVRVQFEGDVYWSESDPTHQYGEFGRVLCARFGADPETRRYAINMESVFFLPIDHSEEDRGEALRAEGEAILTSMGFRAIV
jgi:hypothetical protein